MKGEKGKKVEVGNISFYYHGDGYYCTEPDLDGYCGVSSNDLRVKDGEEYLADMKNKREQENLKLLLKFRYLVINISILEIPSDSFSYLILPNYILHPQQ